MAVVVIFLGVAVGSVVGLIDALTEGLAAASTIVAISFGFFLGLSMGLVAAAFFFGLTAVLAASMLQTAW